MAHKDSLTQPKEDLLPFLELSTFFTGVVVQHIVTIMEQGVTIYGKDNWRTPPYLPKREVLRSLLRHTKEVLQGNEWNNDRAENGIAPVLHAANIACNALMLLTGVVEGWWEDTNGEEPEGEIPEESDDTEATTSTQSTLLQAAQGMNIHTPQVREYLLQRLTQLQQQEDTTYATTYRHQLRDQQQPPSPPPPAAQQTPRDATQTTDVQPKTKTVVIRNTVGGPRMSTQQKNPRPGTRRHTDTGTPPPALSGEEYTEEALMELAQELMEGGTGEPFTEEEILSSL